MAAGRPIQVRTPTVPPIANVMAASWNAGMVPVATVITDSSDHIRIAVRPIRVAVREVMRQSLQAMRPVRHSPKGDGGSNPFCSTANLDCFVAAGSRNDDRNHTM